MALRGEAEEPLLGKEGSYNIPTQPYSNFNGKPYWIQKNGNNAIWYWAGGWVIGKEVNLGTHRAQIYSGSDGVANPYQVTSWKYRYFSHQDWIESNSIVVWPKKSRVPQAIWPSFILDREDKTIKKVVSKPAPEKGVKGDRPLLPPEIHLNRENKTIESAVPFPISEKGDNRGISPFHPKKITDILTPFDPRTMCSEHLHSWKTGVKGDCPLLSPEILLNTEDKTTESAIPFPALVKGDIQRLSPFQSKIFTVIVPLILPLFITAIYFFCLCKYRVFE